MRRIIALVAIGLVVIGMGVLWLLIPQLTGDNDTTTTTSPSSTQVAPQATSSTTTTTSPAPVQTGGSVSFGVVGEPLSLNPLLIGGNAPPVETLSELWTIGLMGLDPKTQDPVPEAANAVPSLTNGGLRVNDDGTMTVRYDLNPDARWENGEAITGFDVAFTYGLMLDPSLPIRPDLRTLHSLILPESIEASSTSITMTLERPTIRFLSLFPVLVPASQIEETDFGQDWNQQTWMSAGPFRFASWDAGRAVRFVRNDRYPIVDDLGERLPYLDELEIAFFSADDALLAAFEFQTVDAALVAADPVLLDKLESSPSIEVQIAAGPEYEHIGFEYGPRRFEANPGSMNESVAFREFLARSLDRKTIVSEVFAGRVSVLDTVVGMSWPAASASGWAEYSVDESLQDRLLAEAVSDLGRDEAVVIFSTTTSVERTQIAGLVLGRLSTAGVSVDVDLLEVGEFFRDKILPGVFDVGEWAWRASPGPVGAVSDLEDRFLALPEDGGYNFYRWGAGDSVASAAADDLKERIAGLDGILDLEVLRAELTAIDALLADDMVLLPLFAAPNAAAAWSTAFEGLDHVAAFPATWNAALWHRIGG